MTRHARKMPRGRKRTTSPPQPLPDPDTLLRQFLLWMRMRNCTERTIGQWELDVRRFNDWCRERGVECVSQVTLPILTGYRRYLFHYRNRRTNRPLKFATQASYLTSVRRWLEWLTKEGFLEENVADELELPKEERRLPMAVLSAEQVERTFEAIDVARPLGVRDRAILELLYSTGMRRAELAGLAVYDVDPERRVIKIRQGKGRKDRVVPVGERALAWLARYLRDVRPRLVAARDTMTVFVSVNGRRLHGAQLSAMVKGYMRTAGVELPGSCHLLRHTAATLMMEHGADLCSLQLYLGHERLSTTQVYTHVSIQRLQEVHAKTHPAESGRGNQEPAEAVSEHEPPLDDAALADELANAANAADAADDEPTAATP